MRVYLCIGIGNGVYEDTCSEYTEGEKRKKVLRKERERDRRLNFLLNLSIQNHIIYRYKII